MKHRINIAIKGSSVKIKLTSSCACIIYRASKEIDAGGSSTINFAFEAARSIGAYTQAQREAISQNILLKEVAQCD